MVCRQIKQFGVFVQDSMALGHSSVIDSRCSPVKGQTISTAHSTLLIQTPVEINHTR